MPRISAGLIMFRRLNGELQVLLVHPGGPYWKNKDDGSWSIPKGEPLAAEDPLAAAQREFREETGIDPVPPFISLAPIRQKNGKTVCAWAFAGDCDPARVRSNPFTIEWPPRSGQHGEFPEIDRAAFFNLPAATQKILPAQIPLLDELERLGAAAA